MNPQNHALATTPSYLPLNDFTDDFFALTTVMKPKHKSAYGAIITFCDLRHVCKGFKEKVDRCWRLFIERAGNASLLLPPYFKHAESEVPLDTIKKQFRALKKWNETNPEVSESLIPRYMEQCIIQNDLGNPVLWAVIKQGCTLARIDLTSRSTDYLDLKEKLNPFSIKCKPYIASSQEWLAICCDDIKKQEMEIAIIEINTSNCCHKISGLNTIQQLHCDDEFLYVLCHDIFGESKLLLYDSKDWNALPKELILPGKVIRFHLGCKELLFVSSCNVNEYQLLATQRENCFSTARPSFSKIPPQANNPLIKCTDKNFLTISPTTDPDSDIPPCVLLEQLHFKNSVLKKRCLQKLPLNISEILDFHVQLDKIFIMQQEKIGFSTSCFNLANGEFIKKICQTTTISSTPMFVPKQLPLSPQRIQLIYNSIHPDAINSNLTPGTAVIIMDFI